MGDVSCCFYCLYKCLLFPIYKLFRQIIFPALSASLLVPDGYENQNNASLYMVLPIVVSTLVLLLGALLISHQR